MFEGLYSNISKKYPKRIPLNQDEKVLSDFLDINREIEFTELVESYTKELKLLLEETETVTLIERITLLEGVLAKLRECDLSIDIPELSHFYQDLSPILLQKYWELDKSESSKETYNELFLHSIHIALEEEIYIWQEKIN